MPLESWEMVHKVRGLIARRYVDCGLLNVSVNSGVVYLTGSISHLRTHPEVDLNEEMNEITHVVRQQHGIREVIWDVKKR